MAAIDQGNQIRLIVGGEAGSACDSWARQIARNMGQHFPGKLSFIVNNMPGGGQIIANNYLFNIADKDASTKALARRGIWLALRLTRLQVVCCNATNMDQDNIRRTL